MQREIRRSIVGGKVAAPASVALAHRALYIASFSEGASLLSGIPASKDLETTLGICRAFGADIVTEGGVADIFGTDDLSPPLRIECNESNTSLKLFMPLASLFASDTLFEGSGYLLSSPIYPYLSYLGRLGATVENKTGYLPFSIRGPVQETELVYPSQLGTQFLSGLLLSAPFRDSPTSIGISGQVAAQEIMDETVAMMRKSGITIEAADSELIYLEGGQQYAGFDDFSIPKSKFLSSFLLLAGALAGKVEVDGIENYPELEQLFTSFGASVTSGDGNLAASIGALEGRKFSAQEAGRLLPHAIVLAAASSGQTAISGLQELSRSEQTRTRLLLREISKMGARMGESEGALIIDGARLKGADIEPEGDPVVTMACAAAALSAEGRTVINGAECVEKRYHSFFSDLSQLGGIVR